MAECCTGACTNAEMNSQHVLKLRQNWTLPAVGSRQLMGCVSRSSHSQRLYECRSSIAVLTGCARQLVGDCLQSVDMTAVCNVCIQESEA
jgi:hypothetical protein